MAALTDALPPPAKEGTVFDAVPSVVSLLDVDTDLADAVRPEHRPAARRGALAEVHTIARGAWPGVPPDPDDMGLLIVSGLMVRIVRVGRRESLELLGQGDLIRPADDEQGSLVACDVRWEALNVARVAKLDARFCRAIAPWPVVAAELASRGVRRAKWQALQAAITAHPTVDERVMLMLSHLGERMGRMTRDGVVLELPVSHRLLSHAVHALRPSVTSGLLRLREAGLLAQPARGTWLITSSGLDYVAGLCRQGTTRC